MSNEMRHINIEEQVWVAFKREIIILIGWLCKTREFVPIDELVAELMYQVENNNILKVLRGIPNADMTCLVNEAMQEAMGQPEYVGMIGHRGYKEDILGWFLDLDKSYWTN